MSNEKNSFISFSHFILSTEQVLCPAANTVKTHK